MKFNRLNISKIAKVLQIWKTKTNPKTKTLAMSIDNDKVTKIFCMADDFCRVYDRFVKVNGLAPKRDKSKRRYHRDGRLSDAEVITIMILFHLGGYKCLKHFYLNEVCRNMTDLFPGLVSYNRFVELERKEVVPSSCS